MAVWQTITALSLSVLSIVLLTSRWKMPAFFALLLASLVSALVMTKPVSETIQLIQKGFGQTMASLAWLVALGTLLGLVLEASGATRQMANWLVRRSGAGQSDRAMAATGFVVGLPVFCDAGFVVLQGLTPALARRSGKPSQLLALSLASGLFVVHCLVPPHPGAAAAAVSLGANTGKVIGWGLLVALPALGITQLWLKRRFRNTGSERLPETSDVILPATPSAVSFAVFLPVVLPVLLIGLRAVLLPYSTSWPSYLLPWLSLGEPVAALFLAVLAAIWQWKNRTSTNLIELLEKTVQQAGPILLVTGAGGSFGAILSSAGLAEQLGSLNGLNQLGLALPFLLCVLLKTAQGSSTVAMLTGSAIVLPLLPQLGLESENGRILCTLALGAGSMVVSHANDSYFWVISRFSSIPAPDMLRRFTPASFIMGAVSWLLILLVSLWLL